MEAVSQSRLKPLQKLGDIAFILGDLGTYKTNEIPNPEDSGESEGEEEINAKSNPDEIEDDPVGEGEKG